MKILIFSGIFDFHNFYYAFTHVYTCYMHHLNVCNMCHGGL